MVPMAQMGVVSGNRIIKTTLGSCVGVVLHDSMNRITGLAHIMLPSQLRDDDAIGKFPETALPALLTAVMEKGASKAHIQAYLAGGASMFAGSDDRRIATIGDQNVEATRKTLARLGIAVAYEQTGGKRGRTLVFDNSSGCIEVRTLQISLWAGADA